MSTVSLETLVFASLAPCVHLIVSLPRAAVRSAGIAMEGVEKMLGDLKLSSEEKRTLKFGADRERGKIVNKIEDRPRAVAKLLSEKHLNPEVIEQSVGWMWCPAKGVSCKDMENNTFLITFNQASGLRRAVDDGPWMISKEALVVEEFDGSKKVDEYDFATIPIWMRVERLPLGLMSREAAVVIGDDVGSFLEVAADGDDSAVGRALRIKIRLDIRKPLRRGGSWQILERRRGRGGAQYHMSVYRSSVLFVASLDMWTKPAPRRKGRMKRCHMEES